MNLRRMGKTALLLIGFPPKETIKNVSESGTSPQEPTKNDASSNTKQKTNYTASKFNAGTIKTDQDRQDLFAESRAKRAQSTAEPIGIKDVGDGTISLTFPSADGDSNKNLREVEVNVNHFKDFKDAINEARLINHETDTTQIDAVNDQIREMKQAALNSPESGRQTAPTAPNFTE